MESAVDGDGSCSPHCNACGLVWFDRDIETAITRGGGMRHDVVVDPDDRITYFEVGRGRTKAHPCHLDNMLGGRRRSRCGPATTKHSREQGRLHRSEEHTAELQSLMRTSKSFFWLQTTNT